MTHRNLTKHKFEKTFNSFIDSISFEKKLSDDKFECMLFGICDYLPKQLEELTFFITIYH